MLVAVPPSPPPLARSPLSSDRITTLALGEGSSSSEHAGRLPQEAGNVAPCLNALATCGLLPRCPTVERSSLTALAVLAAANNAVTPRSMAVAAELGRCHADDIPTRPADSDGGALAARVGAGASESGGRDPPPLSPPRQTLSPTLPVSRVIPCGAIAPALPAESDEHISALATGDSVKSYRPAPPRTTWENGGAPSSPALSTLTQRLASVTLVYGQPPVVVARSLATHTPPSIAHVSSTETLPPQKLPPTGVGRLHQVAREMMSPKPAPDYPCAPLSAHARLVPHGPAPLTAPSLPASSLSSQSIPHARTPPPISPSSLAWTRPRRQVAPIDPALPAVKTSLPRCEPPPPPALPPPPITILLSAGESLPPAHTRPSVNGSLAAPLAAPADSVPTADTRHAYSAAPRLLPNGGDRVPSVLFTWPDLVAADARSSIESDHATDCSHGTDKRSAVGLGNLVTDTERAVGCASSMRASPAVLRTRFLGEKARTPMLPCGHLACAPPLLPPDEVRLLLLAGGPGHASRCHIHPPLERPCCVAGCAPAREDSASDDVLATATTLCADCGAPLLVGGGMPARIGSAHHAATPPFLSAHRTGVGALCPYCGQSETLTLAEAAAERARPATQPWTATFASATRRTTVCPTFLDVSAPGFSHERGMPIEIEQGRCPCGRAWCGANPPTCRSARQHFLVPQVHAPRPATPGACPSAVNAVPLLPRPRKRRALSLPSRCATAMATHTQAELDSLYVRSAWCHDNADAVTRTPLLATTVAVQVPSPPPATAPSLALPKSPSGITPCLALPTTTATTTAITAAFPPGPTTAVSGVPPPPRPSSALASAPATFSQSPHCATACPTVFFALEPTEAFPRAAAASCTAAASAAAQARREAVATAAVAAAVAGIGTNTTALPIPLPHPPPPPPRPSRPPQSEASRARLPLVIQQCAAACPPPLMYSEWEDEHATPAGVARGRSPLHRASSRRRTALPLQRTPLNTCRVASNEAVAAVAVSSSLPRRAYRPTLTSRRRSVEPNAPWPTSMEEAEQSAVEVSTVPAIPVAIGHHSTFAPCSQLRGSRRRSVLGTSWKVQPVVPIIASGSA